MKVGLFVRLGWLVIVFGLLCAPTCAAYVYPFEVFTNNGAYANSPDLNFYVVVSDGVGVVNFTFYNESSISSSLSAIYFDDGSLLGIAAVINGPSTDFMQPATPGDLPAGNMLIPPFVTTDEFCISGSPPPSQNGVNPVEQGQPLEWVSIRFDLVSGGTLEGVVNELNTGVVRIGIHITALPDGSSESAIHVPEPATILLFGAASVLMLRKRQRRCP